VAAGELQSGRETRRVAAVNWMWSEGPSEPLGCVPTPPEELDGGSAGTSGIEGIPSLSCTSISEQLGLPSEDARRHRAAFQCLTTAQTW
jgi:hypothetical protein